MLGFRPRTFAIATSAISAEAWSVLAQYFTVVNVSRSLSAGEFSEFYFWSELPSDCFPVVGVGHTGLFNRAPDSLCQAEPFSAVPRLGDVVYFDPMMMVLDPKLPPTKAPDALNFAKLINAEIIDWNILPSDSSVADIENEYLDFWLLYGSPIFLHFDEDTFRRAVSRQNQTLGSPALFEIVWRIVGAAIADHREIFRKI
jgi:hypothetical protein